MQRCILFLLLVCCAMVRAEEPCNGSSDLCGRRYNEVTYACTHNAMSSNEAGFLFPNQKHGLTKQLNDGIRALMLDIHRGDDGRPMLCHTYCKLGGMDLVQGLREIGDFMNAHQREVVTLLLEPSDVDSNEIAKAFEAAGLATLLYATDTYDNWPTLGEMADSGKRLVVLTDDDPQGVPWLLPMWTVMWDNDWSNKKLDDFDCDCNRGKVTNPLFNLNQFMSNPLPSRSNAEKANTKDGLYARAKECWDKTGRRPNFITVDFHDVGDVVGAVQKLNAIATE